MGAGEAVADVSTRVVVDATATGTTCDGPDGVLVFEPEDARLRVCCSGEWVDVGAPSPIIIVDQGAQGRRWDDGSVAASCEAYLNATGDFQTAGGTGNGLYAIDPSEDGLKPVT